jgi:Gpi18-like mannosyltransferase
VHWRILGLIVGQRLWLLFLVWLGCAVLLPDPEGWVRFTRASVAKTADALISADATWLLRLAEHGYDEGPYRTDTQHNWAFYPLWPGIVALLAPVLGGYRAAAFTANALFLLGAFLLLHRVLRRDLRDETAGATLLLLLVFPSSLVFLKPQTESLFLLLTAGTFLASGARRWWLAGVLAGLATLTRVQGVLLTAVPLAYAFEQYRAERRFDWRWSALLVPPLCLLGFVGYMGRLTGNPLASFQIQITWSNYSAPPPKALWRWLRDPAVIGDWSWNFALLAFVMTVAALWFCVALVRRWRAGEVPLAYPAYAIPSVLICLSKASLQGNPRYLLLAFPLFAALALALRGRIGAQLWLVYACATLQGVYAVATGLGLGWALAVS